MEPGDFTDERGAEPHRAIFYLDARPIQRYRVSTVLGNRIESRQPLSLGTHEAEAGRVPVEMHSLHGCPLDVYCEKE